MDREKEEQIVERFRLAVQASLGPSATLNAELGQLFEEHRARIQRICRRFVGDPTKAEDLTQDVMLTAYKKLPQFNYNSTFATWVYGIARNTCFNAIRKKGELLTEDGVLDEGSDHANAYKALREVERHALLKEAAEAVLTAEEQEAVHLRYVENLPQDRITDLLGIDTASGARGLLQTCRRKLNKELRRRLEEMGHGSSFFRDIEP